MFMNLINSGFQVLCNFSLNRMIALRLLTKERLSSWCQFSYSTLAMSKVYVRNATGEDRLQITFTFPPEVQNGMGGVKQRVYNFDRIKTENLKTTLQRISANVSKFVNRPAMKKKAKQPDGGIDIADVNVRLLDNSSLVDDLKPNDLAWVNGRCLMIDDHQLIVHVNVPTVKKLTLPGVIFVGFAVRPDCHIEFGNAKDSRFTWYRKLITGDAELNTDDSESVAGGGVDSEDDNDTVAICSTVEKSVDSSDKRPKRRKRSRDMMEEGWLEIFQGRSYVPVDADVGCLLKVNCEPYQGVCSGELVSAISKIAVAKRPESSYPFEARHQFTKNQSDFGSFRAVTYNILADLYADSDYTRDFLHPYCPPYALHIDYRKLLILQELMGYNADIICLQEVDRKVYENDLLPSLTDVGFLGILSLKTGDVAEGTATFIRNSKFRLLGQHNLPLAQTLQEDELFADMLEKISQSGSLMEKVVARTSVLQVTMLESLEDSRQQVLVATVHLYFHPQAPHVRVLQTVICLRHIERVLAQYTQQDGRRPAVLYCGDFNSYPEGGVHSFLTEKHISPKHADWYAAGKVDFVEGMEFRHNLDLTSACGYPRYTNYVGGFSGCLDYIYVERSRLATKLVVPLPTHEEVTRFTALPNAVFPSDHIALVCDIAFVNSTN